MNNKQLVKMLTAKYGPYQSDCKERFNCTAEEAARSEGVRYTWEINEADKYNGYSDAAIKAGVEHIKKRYK